MKPGKQAFEKIDLLNRDTEPVGQALAVLDEPSERRLTEITEMAGIEPGRDFDPATPVECDKASKDWHGGVSFAGFGREG